MGPEQIAESAGTPPGDLPRDPNRFWAVQVGWDALELPRHPPAGSALEQLGPSPFGKSAFPFLGFLATVYDHVAERVNGHRARGE